jgi:DedD protein
MDDKNELSDIVLNKKSTSNSNKKIILAVATLGVILIIVVTLMNSINSNSTNNLPQAVLPPKPQQDTTKKQDNNEPLFKDVEVMQENSSSDAELDKIAQKLKQESQSEPEVTPTVATPAKKSTPVKRVTHVVKKEVVKTKKAPIKRVTATNTPKYYIQVGSFSKYEPNKRFLKSIKNLGFNYKYHKVGKLNKVLVGPFSTHKEAENAKKLLRAKVAHGAFLVKL